MGKKKNKKKTNITTVIANLSTRLTVFFVEIQVHLRFILGGVTSNRGMRCETVTFVRTVSVYGTYDFKFGP